MRPKIDLNKLRALPSTEDLLHKKYGERGSNQRKEFDAKSFAWYHLSDTL